MDNYNEKIQEINRKMSDGFFTSKDHQRKVLDLIKETYDLIKYPDQEIANKYFWEQVKAGKFKKMTKIFYINYYGKTRHSEIENMGESVYTNQIFGKDWGGTWRTDNWVLEQPVKEKYGSETYYTRQQCFHKPENLNYAEIEYNTLMEIHHVKEKHKDFMKMMGLDVDAIFHLVELRSQAKEFQIVRPVSKEARIIKMVQRNIQAEIDKGVKIAKLFDTLPISTSTQICSNWNNTTWLRTYWYYNSQLTPFDVIIKIVAQALEDGVIKKEDHWLAELVA